MLNIAIKRLVILSFYLHLHNVISIFTNKTIIPMLNDLVKNIDTLVVIGKWNVFVFSPEWMSKYVFGDAKLQIEFAVPHGSISFKANNINVIVSENSLRLKAEKGDNSNLKDIVDVLRCIVRSLAHTLVSAVGINFKYGLDEDLSKFFKSAKLDEEKVAVIKEEHRWTIDGGEKNMFLNIILTKRGTKFEFDFNNHYPVTSCSDIVSIIEDDSVVITKKEQSISILKDLFNIQID